MKVSSTVLQASSWVILQYRALLTPNQAELNRDELRTLLANPDVVAIEEDAIMSVNAIVTQTDAPWGLSRLSGSPSSTYRYDDSAGAGVDAYVVDTGIYLQHSEFGSCCRVRWGATFGGYNNTDESGHGTHIAATIGGRQFGVAKQVSLIAVKVLGSSGSGAVSDIISGLNWVLNAANTSGRPSVVNMSFGGSISSALDAVVTSLTNSGIHCVVAAGNSATNVSGFSPARVPSAITVSASDINNAFASFANYGSGVDIIAPGVNIISAKVPSGSVPMSGTSSAAPHVAGLAAYLIAKDGNTSPANLSAIISNLAVNGVITGLPSGTPNKLANNGISATLKHEA